jgi:hypothetical protein
MSSRWSGCRHVLAVVAACASMVAEASMGCSSQTAKDSPGAALADGGAGDVGGATGASAAVGPGEAGAPGAGGRVLPGLPTAGNPCNGRDTYCSLRYDVTCFAATHDSAANSAPLWQHPSQDQPIGEQLNGGIRALSLSVYDDAGVVTVCRGNCAEGNTPLGVVLDDVATFLDENPREVLTLLLDGALPAKSLAAEFVAHNLDALAEPHDASDPWPTLGEMIDSGTRLVVIAETDEAAEAGPAWLLPRRDLVWESGNDWPSLSAMTCNPAVGDLSRPLYLVHQRLVEAGEGGAPADPSPKLAEEANELSIVTRRLQGCQKQFGHGPSFVAVDFSRVGDVVGATQVINGVRAP